MEVDITKEAEAIEKDIRNNCLFVLVTNSLFKSPGDMLVDYKTQISVKKRLQQLKSLYFVHTLYLYKYERIEALCYIILIALMLLSVMGHQVRKGLKEDNEIIIGPGGVKVKNPTLKVISAIFSNPRVKKVTGIDFKDDHYLDQLMIAGRKYSITLIYQKTNEFCLPYCAGN